MSSVDALFKALEDWVRVEGCRGCLFLRAYGETGGDVPEIAEAIAVHKARAWNKIQEIIALETNGRGDEQLAEQILILFEGATATAIYRGADAVATARHCAVRLVKQAPS
ncbi:Transcriptional regulator, TetR family [Halomonas citrativorans]|uniref:Transcriptional regulator, TetR family n=1 Tax=Halomonas citrativorans TaxID=2742612 RepID=A0A1R4I3K2_9GAMM|nr:Transcriptional regulator, TetR family [Halomonas citrativorans]